jgi:transglutaminase-like putative cysteine protease
VGALVVGVFSAMLLPSFSMAQKFQEPTKEELQMTTDPKAPGAPAVYLYIEDKMDNGTHVVSEYARIKVLTEKGKESATVHVPYVGFFNGTPSIEARTMHADGTVFPLLGKAADLLIFKNNEFDVKEAVFNMPSVEVGSILEYRWTVPMVGARFANGERTSEFASSYYAGEMPYWEVQRSIYVHMAHYFYNPFQGELSVNPRSASGYMDDDRPGIVLYAQRLPLGFQVIRGQAGYYALDIHDVPAFTREPYAPPASALRYDVRFYLTPLTIPDQFWSQEGARWSKKLDSFAAPTSVIKAAADQIVAGAVTTEAKARKIYEAVQAMDNTDFSRKKSQAERERAHLKAEIRRAEDVLKEKSGTRNDIAALYLAMARAAGLEAYGVQVADRSQRIFDQNYLSLDQLDALVVLQRIDGKDVYLDPGEKLCPFGQLKWEHTLTGGLAQNAKGPIFTPANATKDAITAHAADLTLDARGNVTGTVKVLMNGPEGLYWRQLNLTADKSEVERQFGESLHRLLPAGITAEAASFKGLETSEGYLQATVNVQGPLGGATGKRLLLPAFFFSSSADSQFLSSEKRESAIDMHYAGQVIDDVAYHFPTGYAVESAPPAAQLPWPDHAALVVKVAAPTPGTIDVKHIFARAFVVMDPKEYSSLREYYQKLATTDQQQIVLAPAGATGN